MPIDECRSAEIRILLYYLSISTLQCLTLSSRTGEEVCVCERERSGYKKDEKSLNAVSGTPEIIQSRAMAIGEQGLVGTCEIGT